MGQTRSNRVSPYSTKPLIENSELKLNENTEDRKHERDDLMSGNAVRTKAITDTLAYTLPEPINYVAEPTGKLFASNVFTLGVMKERLPKHVFRSLERTIQSGEPLDLTTADAIAASLKAWAIEKGATHYGHIFLPAHGSYRREKRQLLHANG